MFIRSLWLSLRATGNPHSISLCVSLCLCRCLSLSLSPNPAHSESLQTNKRCQKTQLQILGGCWSLSQSCQLPKSPPKRSAFDHTGAQAWLCGRCIVAPHLQPIKLPCPGSGVRLLWPQSCFAQHTCCYSFSLPLDPVY